MLLRVKAVSCLLDKCQVNLKTSRRGLRQLILQVLESVPSFGAFL